ncbi:MAG: hypothetical protein KUL88_16565, partial [Rhizobium sp.]|nr:hypothetical protein [Rhizobium sp.]
ATLEGRGRVVEHAAGCFEASPLAKHLSMRVSAGGRFEALALLRHFIVRGVAHPSFCCGMPDRAVSVKEVFIDS